MMAFSEAQNYKIPFGMHKDRTIEDVASTDDGLRYLDWLMGKSSLYGRFKEAMGVYMNDPTIKLEVEKAIE